MDHQIAYDFNWLSEHSHLGTCGKVAHFLVAIAYGEGKIRAAQYEGTMNGKLFADFIQDEFPDLFKHSSYPKEKLFLQDGDSSKSSRKANNTMSDVEATDFHIPPRNLGFSPIENVFSDVKCQMQDYALVTMAMLSQLFNRDDWSQYFINE